MGLGGKLFGPSTFDEVQLVRPLLPQKGLMLDVGAHMGGTTLPFAEMGWEVHAFEPDPINRDLLVQAAASHNNVIVVPAAVSNRTGSMTLFRSDVSSGISSLSAFHESHKE